MLKFAAGTLYGDDKSSNKIHDFRMEFDDDDSGYDLIKCRNVIASFQLRSLACQKIMENNFSVFFPIAKKREIPLHFLIEPFVHVDLLSEKNG